LLVVKDEEPDVSLVALRGQGIYYVATGLWPLLHLASFERVTGPKTDDWLVHMVGLLAAAIGGSLLVSARHTPISLEACCLSLASAGAFAAIDVWYVAQDRISPIYLADGFVEAILIVVMSIAIGRRLSKASGPSGSLATRGANVPRAS
jgi:hypothetical protein